MKRYECFKGAPVWHDFRYFEIGDTVDKPDDEDFKHPCFRFLMDVGTASKSIGDEMDEAAQVEEFRAKNRIGRAAATAAWNKANATEPDHKLAVLKVMVQQKKAGQVVGGKKKE